MEPIQPKKKIHSECIHAPFQTHSTYIQKPFGNLYEVIKLTTHPEIRLNLFITNVGIILIPFRMQVKFIPNSLMSHLHFKLNSFRTHLDASILIHTELIQIWEFVRWDLTRQINEVISWRMSWWDFPGQIHHMRYHKMISSGEIAQDKLSKGECYQTGSRHQWTSLPPPAALAAFA